MAKDDFDVIVKSLVHLVAVLFSATVLRGFILLISDPRGVANTEAIA